MAQNATKTSYVRLCRLYDALNAYFKRVSTSRPDFRATFKYIWTKLLRPPRRMWLAVEEVGYPAAEVARFLGISRVGVLLSLEKAKNICQKYEFELTPSNLTDSIWKIT